MARQVVRLRDEPSQEQRRQRSRKRKRRREKVATQEAFDKPFADLTGQEKDELLKMLAIRAELVEE